MTANAPKPLLPCGDRPFVAWLMRGLLRFGVEEFILLTGYRATDVESSVQSLSALLPHETRILVSEEPLRAGTGGALSHARGRLDQRFLLCNGDSLFDCNLARLLAAEDDPDTIGRMMLRRVDDASRYGVVTLQGDRVSAFSARSTTRAAGLINAGIYLFDRSVIDALVPVCSLETDILPRPATEGALCGTVSEGYFLDIGIPDDLARAQQEIPGLLRRERCFLNVKA